MITFGAVSSNCTNYAFRHAQFHVNWYNGLNALFVSYSAWSMLCQVKNNYAIVQVKLKSAQVENVTRMYADAKLARRTKLANRTLRWYAVILV